MQRSPTSVRLLIAAFVSALLLTALLVDPGQTDDKPSPKGADKAADAKDKKGPNLAPMKQALQRYLTDKSGRAAAGTAVPAKASPWVWCWESYEAVPKQDPKVLYALVAEHLLVADKRYLGRKEVEERRKGLGIAVEASGCAVHRLKDTKLAVQICEAYIRPNLDAADENSWKYLSTENVIEAIVDAYAAAEDAPKMGEALKLLIEKADDRNTADAARLRLAQVLARQGEYEEAIRHLKDIDPEAGVGGGRRLIGEYEKKLQETKEKRK